MRIAFWGIYGASLAVIYGALVGILSIQIVGLRGGAVFDLNNVLVAVTEPRAPLLRMLALALLSCLVVFGLTVGISKRRDRDQIAAVTAFAFLMAGFIVGSFLLTNFGTLDVVSLGRIAPGPLGWIDQAGSSPLTHVLPLLAIGALWFRLRHAQRERTEHEAVPIVDRDDAIVD